MIQRGGEKLFSVIDLSLATERKAREIAEKIAQLTSESIRTIDIDEYVKILEKEESVTLLQVTFDQPIRGEERECFLGHIDYGIPTHAPATSIPISFPYAGSSWLFRAFGAMQLSSPPRALVESEKLTFIYIVPVHMVRPQVSDDILRQLERDKKDVQSYLRSVNAAAEEFNTRITRVAREELLKRRERLSAGRSLAESLGIPLERVEPKSVEVLHPKPRAIKIDKGRPPQGTTRTPEWTLVLEDYDYILSLIEQMILVMEKSPKTFSRMREEELRDILLVILNAHFNGGATGEKFNVTGKTDILIRHEGRNAFIAECKFWHGAKSFSEAIDQLLGYSGWRDTKTALIVFNRRGRTSSTIRSIPQAVAGHSSYKRTLEGKSETHLRFVLGQQRDPDREIHLAVLVFDVPSDDQPT